MAEGTRDPQVVFLVDLSTCRQKGSKWDEAISLFVFRTLCFFNCQLRYSGSKDKPNKKVLKWGYKLFDIDGKDAKVGSLSPSFKDFKLKSFEEFERNLNNVATGQQQTTSDTSDTRSKPTDISHRTRKGLTVSSYPARCLSQTLTETLHDFQWETPDIGSPVKSRKRQSWSEQNRIKSNYVFLISRVPCDRKTLRHFSNKVVMDKDVFLESFMSQALQKEFCDQHKIHLCWVDCGRYQIPNNANHVPPEKKSFEIVEQSLRSVAGALVAFYSVVTHLSTLNQQRHFAQLAPGGVTDTGGGVRDLAASDVSTGGKKEQSGTWTDEVAVVLSSFSCMSACTALVNPCRTQGSSAVTRGQQETPAVVRLIIGGKDTTGSTCVLLRLVPVTQTASTSTSTSTSTSRRAQAATDQCQVQLHCGTDKSCCLLTSHRKMPRVAQSTVATQLEVRGFMEKAEVRHLGANLGNHSLCFVSENAPRDQHLAFSSLLEAVYSQQQTLVLSIRVGQEPSPHLAVLEAASARSAYLSYLSLATTLQVEKVMALPALPDGNTEKLPDPAIGRSALQAFKDRAVRAIMTLPVVRSGQDRCSEGQRLWPGLLNPWHVAGSMTQLHCALDSLTHRAPEARCDTQGGQVDTQLAQVQQVYQQENQTPHLLPSSCPPLSRTTSADRSREEGSGSESRSALRRESSFLARGRLMVSKAKLSGSLALDEVDGDCPPRVTAEAVPKLDVSHVDVKSIEDLCQYLQDQYDTVLDTGLGLESAAQCMVTKSSVEFLRGKVLKSCKELKEHYQNLASEEDGKAKITEFKLQIVLRLEMESVYSSVDQADQDLTATQVVELLRSLLFVADAVEVPLFLNNVILTNYVSTLPQLLVTVYDELMQPLPDALAAFGSPPSSTPGKPRGPLSVSSVRSAGPESAPSVPPGSNQSASSMTTRPRSKLRSHPSLTGQGTKRQIVVQSRPKVDRRGKVKADSKSPRRSPRKSPGKHHHEKVNPAVKKARRNLFNTQTGRKKDDGEKRKTTPRKKRHSSPPSKKSKDSKTFVAETPRHRQRSRLAWRREQVTKHLSRSGPPEVQVIQESPLKQIAHLKDSPGSFKPARRVLRQSFYSAGRGRHSRNLARALELSNRIAGRHHRHEHLGEFSGGRLSDAIKSKDPIPSNADSDDILSPKRRAAAAFLRAQLMSGSPSPSPDLQSPSSNTRSKTPQRTPRQRLFQDDGPSLPAWSSSVVSRLDFTSPVKHCAPPSQSSGSMLVTETPPRAGGGRGWLVGDTSTKQEVGVAGHVTPVKVRAGTSGHVTPVKGRAGTSGHVTPVKGRAGTSGHVTPVKGRASTFGHVTPVKGRAGTSGHVTPVKGRAGTSGHVTPVKGRASTFGHVTPVKGRAGTSGHVTPVKGRASTFGHVTPVKGRAGTSGHVTPVKGRASTSGHVTPVKGRAGTFVHVTPVKGRAGTSGHVTPVKGRAGTSGHVTPVKVGSSSCGGGGSLEEATSSASDQDIISSTPQKGSTHVVPSQLTPRKSLPWSTDGPCASTSPAQTGRAASSRPRKGDGETRKGGRGRGGGGRTSRRLKGVSPSHSTSSSSSSSQQSSILDYVSPTRKAASQASELPSPPRCSQRIFSRNVLSPRSSGKHATATEALVSTSSAKGCGDGVGPATGSRPGPAGVWRTPTKTRPEFSSPTKTRFMDFTSSTKTSGTFTSPPSTTTPTKPILKSSPYFQRSQSGASANRTPQKSPRVSFDVAGTGRDSRTPSPTGGEGRVKTPDSIDKWRRRKRRWTGENSTSKFPSSLDAGGVKGSSGAASDRQLAASRKRDSSVFSETASGVASPCKKRRPDGGGVGVFSQPVSFSDNAVDGYFSASSDSVFLETSTLSSAGQEQRLFPLQTGQPDRLQLKAGPSQGPGLIRCKSTFTGSEGSQGFDISTGSKDTEPPPSSPIFSISPQLSGLRTRDSTQQAQHATPGRLSLARDGGRGTGSAGSKTKGKRKRGSHTLSRADVERQQAHDGGSLFPWQEAESGTAARKHAVPTADGQWSEQAHSGPFSQAADQASAATQDGESLHTVTPPRPGGAQISPSGRRLTPLRVKGTPTDRKYSPSVSTSSLVQLMSSPLLLEKDDQDSTSPKERRPRKKLRKMPPFLE